MDGSKTIYLDHAAATPLDDDVLRAMTPYFSTQFYNPSALYSAAENVRRDVDGARADVAALLGCRPSEIIFTAGGTEANNLAIHGVMEYTRMERPQARMLTSAIEHDSVLGAAGVYNAEVVPVGTEGLVGVDKLAAAVSDDVALISVMYANNEIGSVQPIKEIGRLVTGVRDDRRRRGVDMPLYLHIDAAQAANYLDLHVSRLGVDLLTLNGGKIYGPKQSGVLYVRAGLVLSPLVRGGGQEQGLRSGTENVPGIIGFAAALKLAAELRPQESRRLADLQQYFFTKLARLLPQARVNGSLRRRLPNNLHFTLPGSDNERLLYQLDAAGVMAAAGSACSASSDTPSHVLRAIGLSDAEARSSLRMTMGRATTQADLDQVLGLLKEFVGPTA